MTWLPWVLLPTVGALIGYATNWLAIRMLFHPRRKRFGFQGLLPRRQADLAASIGQVVGKELVSVDRLLAPLAELDLRPHIEPLIDRVLDRKLADLRSIPLLGKLFRPENLRSLRDGVVDELLSQQPQILAKVRDLANEHVDVARITEERVASLDLDGFERLVRRVAKTEFRAIEWWGAVLGAIIGLAQAGLLALLA